MDKYEQETIINFNKEEKIAHIFTYEKTWQRHLEGKLGLKPTMDNGKGGRGYEIDKNRIKMPRAPKKAAKRGRVSQTVSGKKSISIELQNLGLKAKSNDILPVKKMRGKNGK